ncbi:hypothetical protein DdX_16891 [Ditylenchus destructor]|uniref:Uncharacterized protein n=1 Tax=Ditylenchus destructor TaxID=166010 RepID=A0AAD4MMN2_9BILA|nr:hypothetical protein DdX_16891 [Ditylenchus destructor]
MEKKQTVLQACKKLSSNKLEGTHTISISPMMTPTQLQMKNVTLAVKRACEEYSKEAPGEFVNKHHMKLVGFNRLDDSDKKNPPKHFKDWLQALVDKSKEEPCEAEKFKQSYDNAMKLAADMGINIKND